MKYAIISTTVIDTFIGKKLCLWSFVRGKSMLQSDMYDVLWIYNMFVYVRRKALEGCGSVGNPGTSG